MTDELESTAQRLAERGRDALVARLREAYAQAARTHGDIVQIDEARLEELVQRSADRADGLQWRRALADVACEELGVGLTEALHHPAVVRAQELVGAPSYEDSLSELTGRPTPEPEPAPRSAERPKPKRTQERSQKRARPAQPTPRSDRELRFAAVHLGGVANLPTAESGIDVRVSGEGLDIIRDDTEIIGRLGWSDIQTLEVASPRGGRRRRAGRARLIVRTAAGDASFEVPALTGEELRERLDPLVALYGRD